MTWGIFAYRLANTPQLGQHPTEVFTAFGNHALPFGQEAAVAYAPLVHRRELPGLPIDGFDAQIAAICGTHRATLATLTGKDFEHTGITVVDPWQSD